MCHQNTTGQADSSIKRCLNREFYQGLNHSQLHFRAKRSMIKGRSSKNNVLIGLTQQNDKLEFVEESQSIEQHCHSEPVRTTFVGISIEFRAAHRHTDCSILLFSEILPREIVLLSRRLPRQFANWLAMTGNSIARQIPICILAEQNRYAQKTIAIQEDNS